MEVKYGASALWKEVIAREANLIAILPNLAAYYREVASEVSLWKPQQTVSMVLKNLQQYIELPTLSNVVHVYTCTCTKHMYVIDRASKNTQQKLHVIIYASCTYNRESCTAS